MQAQEILMSSITAKPHTIRTPPHRPTPIPIFFHPLPSQNNKNNNSARGLGEGLGNKLFSRRILDLLWAPGHRPSTICVRRIT